MRIQQIISGKVIAITVILVTIVLTFAFAVSTIQSWKFKKLDGQESILISENDAQIQPAEAPIAPTVTPQNTPAPTSHLGTPSQKED
jgi:hypothetical protein